MKILSLIAVLMMCSLSVQASEEAFLYVPDHGGLQPARDAFYSQPPMWAGINASDGYDTEIADDIPSFLAGQSFNEVTFYVGQWLAVWTDPFGLALDIYFNQCPPGMESDLHYEFPWSELNPELVYHQTGYMTIYEVTASLPSAVTITTSMSVGGYVIIDWGDGAPYCGFCPTEWDVLYGCNELYWDSPTEGAPRWTPLSVATGYFGNLAYGLSMSVAPVPDSETALRSTRLLSSYPNPFNPRTTIAFDLAERETVSLRVFDMSGRLVKELIATEDHTPGHHEVVWNGRNDADRQVASGTYFYRLETSNYSETKRMVLVK